MFTARYGLSPYINREVSSLKVKGEVAYVIMQAVICRLLTAKALVKSESSACRIYDDQNSTFFPVTLPSPRQLPCLECRIHYSVASEAQTMA